MGVSAYFGINNGGVNLTINLLILFAVVIWLALVYWTYNDARRRIEDPMLVACATAASLFPFVGTIVYLIVRPPEFLDDVRERELEMQAAEARLHQVSWTLCPHCDYEIERDFLVCPNCLRKLKDPCVNCGRPLDQAWSVCPYCETPVPGASPPRRARRRRETADVAARETADAGDWAENSEFRSRREPSDSGSGRRTADSAPVRRETTESRVRRETTESRPRRDTTESRPRRDTTESRPRRDSTESRPRRDASESAGLREAPPGT
jgi:hypothetical protein